MTLSLSIENAAEKPCFDPLLFSLMAARFVLVDPALLNPFSISKSCSLTPVVVIAQEI
jgi:hypothetical protein